jgi:hypothetical protein
VIGAATPDLHDLAERALAARHGALGDVVTYRRGDPEEADALVVTCDPAERIEASVARIEAAAAGPDVRAIAVRWEGGAGRATGLRVLRTFAAARLALAPTVRLAGGWRDLGEKLAQVALAFGVDDLGAIATDAEEERLRRWTVEAGFVPRRRDASWRLLPEDDA